MPPPAPVSFSVPTVTLLYGGVCALLVTILGLDVSLQRIREKTYVGAEPSRVLARHIRAHGNAAEWVPIGVLLLLVLELSGTGTLALHVFGGTFVLARLLHAIGVLGKNRASVIAAAINYTILAAMGAFAILVHFRPY